MNKQHLIYAISIGVVILLIAVIIPLAIASRGSISAPIKSLKSPQQAATPLGYPLKADTPEDAASTVPAFDPRLIQLTAFERAHIPTVTRMASSMGSEHGALTYNAQPYWSDNPKRGGHHTGDDLNGIGGMNTDLGAPIHAIANGLVVYRGEPSPGWGKTLMLAHRTTKGKILITMYAHLDRIYAAYGDLVPLGKTIGTCGTANLNYPAHLHLEMRDSTGVHIGPGYTNSSGETIDPKPILAAHRSKDPSLLHPTPLSIILAEVQKERKDAMQIIGFPSGMDKE
ncbi:MAG: M23 family metallopeptidase [Akkermansiaceae bacterium]